MPAAISVGLWPWCGLGRTDRADHATDEVTDGVLKLFLDGKLVAKPFVGRIDSFGMANGILDTNIPQQQK